MDNGGSRLVLSSGLFFAVESSALLLLCHGTYMLVLLIPAISLNGVGSRTASG
jgi:hypothetical protein